MLINPYHLNSSTGSCFLLSSSTICATNVASSLHVGDLSRPDQLPLYILEVLDDTNCSLITVSSKFFWTSSPPTTSWASTTLEQRDTANSLHLWGLRWAVWKLINWPTGSSFTKRKDEWGCTCMDSQFLVNTPQRTCRDLFNGLACLQLVC